MNLQNLKLVTFDATNTLFKFRVPPWQYYTKVAKGHGFHGTEDDVKTKLLYSYKIMCNEHPNFGKSSIAWQNWWSQLVKMTLRDYLPVTADLNSIASKLIDDFKTTRCWCMADGANKLVDHLRKRNIAVGIISNFDPRLYDLLQSFRLEKSFDFIALSYEIGYSKPDERIFKRALDMCRDEVKPSQALHIGDDIQKDYEGARAAGWHSLLVNSKVFSEIPPAHQHTFCSLEDLYSSINHIKL